MAKAVIHGLEDGARAVEALLHSDQSSASGARPVVGLTGPVGAGKTTLASMLAEILGATVVSTDRYLPDYAQTPETERDHPASSSLDELVSHLAELRAGRTVDLPIWSFQEHRRVATEPARPGSALLVEGIHALAEPVASALNLAVFVEAAAGDRLARWDDIESRGERGMGVESAREFFHGVAEPTFKQYEAGYRERADLVIVNPGRPR